MVKFMYFIAFLSTFSIVLRVFVCLLWANEFYVEIPNEWLK